MARGTPFPCSIRFRSRRRFWSPGQEDFAHRAHHLHPAADHPRQHGCSLCRRRTPVEAPRQHWREPGKSSSRFKGRIMAPTWNSNRGNRKSLSSRALLSWVALSLLTSSTISIARAGDLARSNAAYARQDYVRAAKALSHAARRGNRQAQGRLGFMYENGLGVPQAYDAAASLYIEGAIRGDPFAQSRLGLMYDKGHGVPQDYVLAYKWLNLAAGRASRRERDVFLRLRDAVSSKMTPEQILEGQRLALDWRLWRVVTYWRKL